MDRRGRPRLHPRQGARLRAARRRREGPGGAARRRAVRHAGATAGPGCSRRAGSSTGPSRPTTSRTSRRSTNPLYGQRSNPVARRLRRAATTRSNPSAGEPGADVYPFVVTTYRLTEHHTAGGMSRTLPYLSELQPEFFCEVEPGAGARARARARRLGDDRHRPHGDRGAGDGDRADQTAAGRRADDAPGRPALPLGQHGAQHRATRPTTSSALSLDPNVHIQEVEGRRPATSSRAGGRAGRSCRPSSPSTGSGRERER